MRIKLEKTKFEKKNIKKVPQENGVYIFTSSGKPIYVGKSTNLKQRLESYLSTPLNEKTKRLVTETSHFSTICVSSELEALLLEAKLVNLYRPKYNIQLKDDKHPLYIKITKEPYPRVITSRKKEGCVSDGYYFGPFPSSRNVRDVLKIFRRIFPYAQHTIGKRACIYNQMGLCNPCPNIIEKQSKKVKANLRKKYLKNIRMIKSILYGNISSIKKVLEGEMEDFAKKEVYERAIELREKIKKINYITQPITSINSFLENPNLLEDIRQKEINELSDLLAKFLNKKIDLKRIECYDVAHLAGNKPTASMVTFINASSDNSLYRHFRIRQKKSQSDTDSLNEVIKRRSKYFSSWGIPDLIIVDGGKGQVSTFLKVLYRFNIPVVGIAKRNETLVIPIKTNSSKIEYKSVKIPKGPSLNLVRRIRDEAHRFARRYHHKLLGKQLTAS